MSDGNSAVSRGLIDLFHNAFSDAVCRQCLKGVLYKQVLTLSDSPVTRNCFLQSTSFGVSVREWCKMLLRYEVV